MSRFTIENPPIPRDAISDSKTLADPPNYVAVLKIGHAPAWIEGAEYECDRIVTMLECDIESYDRFIDKALMGAFTLADGEINRCKARREALLSIVARLTA